MFSNVIETVTTKASEFIATTTGKVVVGVVATGAVGLVAKKGYDFYTGRKNKASDIVMDVAEKVEVAETKVEAAKENFKQQVEDLKEEIRQAREAAGRKVDEVANTEVKVEINKEGVSIETSKADDATETN